MHIVGQVVDIIEAGGLRMRLGLADPVEIDVVDRPLGAVAVDEIQQRAADALDRRDLQLAGIDAGCDRLGAERDGALERMIGIGDAAIEVDMSNIDQYPLTTKLMSPWRYSVTRLDLCRATGAKPMVSNSAPSFSGSDEAYSTNSNPSVPIGLDSVISAGGASCG